MLTSVTVLPRLPLRTTLYQAGTTSLTSTYINQCPALLWHRKCSSAGDRQQQYLPLFQAGALPSPSLAGTAVHQWNARLFSSFGLLEAADRFAFDAILASSPVEISPALTSCLLNFLFIPFVDSIHLYTELGVFSSLLPSHILPSPPETPTIPLFF